MREWMMRALYARGYWDENDGRGNDLGGGTEPTGDEDTGEEEHEETMLDAVAAAVGGEREPDDLDEEEPAGAPQRGADGRFLPRDGETPEQAAAREAAEQAAQDPFTAPIEEGVGERTRQRIEKMVEGHNQLKAHTTEVETRLRGVQELFGSTGASDQDLAETFDYLRLRNSNSREEVEQAFQVAEAEYHRLALALGRETTQADPLGDRPDLRQRVDNMELSLEDALAIKRGDQDANRLGQQRQQHDQQVAQEQAYREAVGTAQAQLNALTTVFQQDVDYGPKRQMLDASLPGIIQAYPPDQWVAAVQREWERIGALVERMGANAAPPRSPNPARPTGVPSVSAGEPTSMLEAVQSVTGGAHA